MRLMWSLQSGYALEDMGAALLMIVCFMENCHD